ncbi:MAG: UDP-N-acetylmuramoyl-L-alanyl-D-glutamate--2,6-diaminopimelate ligase [Methylocystaceae bacterium]
MQLKQCLNQIAIKNQRGNLEVEIKGITYDSRQVQPGDLFVCVPGFKVDGHNFAVEACEKGAAALVVEHELELDLPQVVLEDSRQSMSFLAANFYGQPQHHLKVIGVTGTNGKTTTTHLIKAILETNGQVTALMGTLYGLIGDYREEMHHTTPEAMDILRFFRRALDAGASHLVMEVSSHALDLGRVASIPFAAAIFTNLTQDHLDYHHNLDEYRQAKIKLFGELAPDKPAIINLDDPSATEFIGAAPGPIITYGLKPEAMVRAEAIHITLTGTRFLLVYGSQQVELNLKLVGMFSVYNVLAAAAYAYADGIELAVVKKAVEQVAGVAGRYETVEVGQPFAVVVDYAHTPDGLENVLKTSVEVKTNRLITVFGCGGDRDRTKRPIMGEISARYSDFTIVTSDNPRTEEPLAIIREIEPGVQRVTGADYIIEADRREAIRRALTMAEPGDLVMIAGKGHEDYQLIGSQVLHFDDREVAREILEELLAR